MFLLIFVLFYFFLFLKKENRIYINLKSVARLSQSYREIHLEKKQLVLYPIFLWIINLFLFSFFIFMSWIFFRCPIPTNVKSKQKCSLNSTCSDDVKISLRDHVISLILFYIFIHWTNVVYTLLLTVLSKKSIITSRHFF